MILRFDDGSSLQLYNFQVEDFSLLKNVAKLCKDEECELELREIDSHMVHDFFNLHRRLKNGDDCGWFFEKLKNSGPGYARDFISLNIYLGNESTADKKFARICQQIFETLPDSLISHGFGLLQN